MIFRKAEKEDFDKIRSLYWNLIDQEQDDPSFPHWKKGIHPSDKMIQNSIDGEELYVLADGDEIAACVIANDEKVDGYSDAPWQIDSDEVIVLHVLAVHPNHRGKGLARKLVENVIEQERKAGKKALRLDVIIFCPVISSAANTLSNDGSQNHIQSHRRIEKNGFQFSCNSISRYCSDTICTDKGCEKSCADCWNTLLNDRGNCFLNEW